MSSQPPCQVFHHWEFPPIQRTATEPVAHHGRSDVDRSKGVVPIALSRTVGDVFAVPRITSGIQRQSRLRGREEDRLRQHNWERANIARFARCVRPIDVVAIRRPRSPGPAQTILLRPLLSGDLLELLGVGRRRWIMAAKSAKWEFCTITTGSGVLASSDRW